MVLSLLDEFFLSRILLKNRGGRSSPNHHTRTSFLWNCKGEILEPEERRGYQSTPRVLQ